MSTSTLADYLHFRTPGARLSCALGLMLGLVMVGGGVKAAEPIPKALGQASGLALGNSIQDFIGLFSHEELDSEDRGVRVFEVKVNSLPQSAVAMHVEFQDNRVVYIEVALEQDATGWTGWVAGPIQDFGAPQDWRSVVGVGTVFTGPLTDSAVWTDESATLAYGRRPSGRIVVLTDPSWQATLKKRLAKREEQLRSQASTAAEAERAEQQRKLEERQALEAKAVEAERLAQEALSTAAIEKAKNELASHVRAEQIPGQCTCRDGMQIIVGCSVANDSIIPAVVTVEAGGQTSGWSLDSSGRFNVTVPAGGSVDAKLATTYSGLLNCSAAGRCWCRATGAIPAE